MSVELHVVALTTTLLSPSFDYAVSMDGILLTLKNVGLAQMVLAWLFVACYALAVGGMLGARGTWRAGVMAICAGVAFSVLSHNWVHGVLLVLFAVAGMALFVILTWALAHACAWLIGRHRAHQAEAPASPAAQPVAARRPVAVLRALRRSRVAP